MKSRRVWALLTSKGEFWQIWHSDTETWVNATFSNRKDAAKTQKAWLSGDLAHDGKCVVLLVKMTLSEAA